MYVNAAITEVCSSVETRMIRTTVARSRPSLAARDEFNDALVPAISPALPKPPWLPNKPELPEIVNEKCQSRVLLYGGLGSE